MVSPRERSGALEAIDRILNRGGDTDDVLRAVLQVLFQLYAYVGLSFVEGDRLVLGPYLGVREEGGDTFSIRFQGTMVAELYVCFPGSDPEEQAFLERVATLISAYCLVAWDTGGVPRPDLG